MMVGGSGTEQTAMRQMAARGEVSFPGKTLALSLFFILCTPFVNGWLVLVPMAIQLYRMGRYDAHVFMVDVVFLLPFSAIFMIPNVGMALGVLIVFGDLCYAVRKWSFPVRDSLVWLVILSVDLLLRMQREGTTFVFILGGLLFMYLMLDCADEVDALWVRKGFVAGLMIASVYGMIFRGKPQIVRYISLDVPASIEYQNLHRFSGLTADSNYFSVFLILAMVLLLQLYILRKIRLSAYLGSMALFSFFGIQTYSRTFFLMFVLVLGSTIVLLFRDRAYGAACLLTMGALFVVGLAAAGKISAFHVIFNRFSSAQTLDSLTSGRSALFSLYWNHCIKTPGNAFWGSGLSAGLLGGKGSHNLYIEVLYCVGLVGLVSYIAYVSALVLGMRRKWKTRLSFSLRVVAMLPLIVLLGVYLSLQGMKAITSYVQFFVALAAILLPAAPGESADLEEGRNSCTG